MNVGIHSVDQKTIIHARAQNVAGTNGPFCAIGFDCKGEDSSGQITFYLPVDDWETAKEIAALWNKLSVSFTMPEPPKPNKSVSEMLAALPVVGTLNVDTNKFTPAT